MQEYTIRGLHKTRKTPCTRDLTTTDRKQATQVIPEKDEGRELEYKTDMITVESV